MNTKKIKVIDIENPSVVHLLEIDEKTGLVKSWKSKRIENPDVIHGFLEVDEKTGLVKSWKTEKLMK